MVFFHPYFSDGGVERTNIGLSKELIKHGYEVTFITICPSKYFINEVHKSGIEFVVLPSKSTLSSQPAFVRWLFRKRKTVDSIVVISCQYYVNLSCLIFKPLWGKKIRHILSERNHIDEFKINQHGLRQRVVRSLVPVLYRFADKVIANSTELSIDLEKLTGREVLPIYNPSVNPRLYNLASEPIEEKWFKDLNQPVILAVGRLAPQKDFETLIRAFARLRRDFQASLVILGEGGGRSAIEDLVEYYNLESSVIMPGFVANPYKFMKAADLFVLSSVYEGLPNVLIEALAMGTDVVSTACRSGPTEILNNGRYGSLVPVGDDKALSKAMKWVVEHKVEAFEKTQKAIISLKRYKPETVGTQLVTLLKNMEC